MTRSTLQSSRPAKMSSWRAPPRALVQHVPGRVQGIEGESLVFQFNGQNRKIALSKVAGIYLAGGGRRHSPPMRRSGEIVEVYGGIKIPGQIASLDATTTKVRTQWGQTLAFKTDELVEVAIKNGKAISLTELQPREVQQVPFFDRMIGYRVNESLAGGPILLRDGKHNRGISVHAKTVLTYAIGGRFQRFRAKLGFQLPEGELGDASIRVLGDGKQLFERSSLRGDGPIESLDLDVSGVETLTLAVDFGRHEDIGDRVVWADPTLIRSETGPYVRAQSDAPGEVTGRRTTSTSHELGQRGAAFHDVTRTAAGIEIRRVGGNAHVMIQRRCQIARSDRAILDLSTVGFGGADHLTVAEAASGHEHRHADRPMVPPVGAVLSPHLRRAAELAHGDHQHIIDESLFLEVEDQRGQQMVEQGGSKGSRPRFHLHRTAVCCRRAYPTYPRRRDS